MRTHDLLLEAGDDVVDVLAAGRALGALERAYPYGYAGLLDLAELDRDIVDVALHYLAEPRVELVVVGRHVLDLVLLGLGRDELEDQGTGDDLEELRPVRRIGQELAYRVGPRFAAWLLALWNTRAHARVVVGLFGE